MARIQLITCQQNDEIPTTEIRLPPLLMKHWDIPYHQTVVFRCGNHEVEAECVPLLHDEEDEDFVLEASTHVFQELKIPSPSRIRIAYHKDRNTVVVGPVFAVLVQTFSKGENRFGSMTSFCEEMAHYANRNCLLYYVITLEQTTQEPLVASIYVNGEWKEVEVPFPDVVYNRIGSRQIEESMLTQNFFEKLEELSIPIFNSRFLSKWESYEAIQNHKELHPHLPETRLFNDLASLEEMLETHDTLFIKPIHGSQGKGIFRVIQKQGVYCLRYSSLSPTEELQFTSALQLFVALKKRIKKRSYLIQQGIDITTLQGKALDFRILCIRDIHGKWKVSSAVGRVSPQDKFVSNVSQGGQMYSVEDLLEKIDSKEDAKKLKKAMIELALECSSLLESFDNGVYGEFGVDIGVASDGLPWIIEINTKPSKQYTGVDSEQTIRPSAKSLVHFAYYLSQFPYLQEPNENPKELHEVES
ncbi:YheC/YheD family protein [Bacillus alkalicellulosilyticus]|uniref:YheC/YheD family endospore coat-associated protein n=1 Tax=Alkalihalobacterium alkalicellulosilyticum TaxID=1912214 RepID=UPI00099667A4|nr:YheC/YheD family protein [Bacillus alkalicellulosilyticus]